MKLRTILIHVGAATLAGVCGTDLWAQDTLVAQRADSVDIIVTPVVSGAGPIRYEYSLESLPTSAQDLWDLSLEVPAEGVSSPTAPPGWNDYFGDRLGTSIPGKLNFAWADIEAAPEDQLTPGRNLTGFSFESDWLPGDIGYWARGFTPLPEIESHASEPDTVLGWRLYENSVPGRTLGPAFPPSAVADPAGVLVAMEDVRSLSCSQGWISAAAACDSLSSQLADVQTSLAVGDVDGAGGELDEFEQVLDAEHGGTIDESAFSALDLYVSRLRGQGLVASEGGEGCGPGYWKQPHHASSWQSYTPGMAFSTVFEDAFSGLTLLDVLELHGGGLNALGRHAVAALLNSVHGEIEFALSVASVINEFNSTFPGSNAEYQAQKDRFEAANIEVCPL